MQRTEHLEIGTIVILNLNGLGGGNYASMRTNAAKQLIGYIQTVRTENNISKDEPVTLVGHSHGGNVSIEAINMMADMKEFEGITINLMTINTPVRQDYQRRPSILQRDQYQC